MVSVICIRAKKLVPLVSSSRSRLYSRILPEQSLVGAWKDYVFHIKFEQIRRAVPVLHESLN